MKLAQFAQGRNNNFNLIRLVAAMAVLVSHSFELVAGRDIDPLVGRLGMSLGAIAVDIFFISSGFLVTGSLFARKSTAKFVWARILRIYPAMVMVVFFMIFVVGLFFTTLSPAAFLSSSQTLDFAFRNVTLISGVRFYLPGVFGSVPYGAVVNGSLWTMVYELRMYAILAIVWPVLYLTGKFRVQALNIFIVMVAASSLLVRLTNYYYLHSVSHFDFIRLLYMFFVGAAFFVLKDRLELRRGVFWLVLAVLMASALDQRAFFAVYTLGLAYLVFWIAYVPAGAIRNFNRLGDYSYGVYVYAFPIQQAVIALIPRILVAGMMALSSVGTLTLAALSWHFIEKRALSLKTRPATVPRQEIELHPEASPATPSPNSLAV